MSLTQEGLPVRTVITEHDQGMVISATVEIPAINFPLVIAPPPAKLLSMKSSGRSPQKQRKRVVANNPVGSIDGRTVRGNVVGLAVPAPMRFLGLLALDLALQVRHDRLFVPGE